MKSEVESALWKRYSQSDYTLRFKYFTCTAYTKKNYAEYHLSLYGGMYRKKTLDSMIRRAETEIRAYAEADTSTLHNWERRLSAALAIQARIAELESFLADSDTSLYRYEVRYGYYFTRNTENLPEPDPRGEYVVKHYDARLHRVREFEDQQSPLQMMRYD